MSGGSTGIGGGEQGAPGPARERNGRVRDATIPLRKLIPNLITAASLCAGVAGVHFAQQGAFEKAIGAIVVAFVLDGLDGRMARLLKATSRFGETFDSIADFTAFGAAPAFIMYQWIVQTHAVKSSQPWEALVALVVVIYALCAAIRLARFTMQARRKKIGAPTTPFFQGLPAPASGGAALVPAMLSLSSASFVTPYWAAVAWLLLLSVFMVSTIPMLSIKGVRISRRLILPLMAGVGILALGVMKDAWLTGSVFFLLYLATFPIAVVLHRRHERASAGAGLSSQGRRS